jgi:hypothetical protein
MGLAAHKAGIGQLTFAVPFQQIYLGDAQGFSWAAVARDDDAI